MAVQAPYPLNAFSNEYEQHGSRFVILNGTLFSELESDFTYNVTSSRKRSRDIEMDHLHHYQKQRTEIDYKDRVKMSAASTSGRSQDQHLNSFIYDQNLELDAFIELQNQKLQELVEETRKMHCRSLEWVMEQQIFKKMEEKERELQKVKRVNAELEEKVKQMGIENQIWFNMAKNSEATVFNLRQSLVQLLLYNSNAAASNNHEGFGETDGGGGVVDDDDAQSSPMQTNKSCKGCGGADVSVLVLPCRHLCLCKDCELRVYCCPVCHSIKKDTLHVNFS